MKRENPLKKTYDIIDKEDIEYKLKNLPPMPRFIELEITNHCNFKCLMCKTGLGIAKRKRGYMTDEVFEKIVSEIEGSGTILKFVGQGEPPLHDEFLNYIKYASERGIICHLTTNGSLLTDKMIEGIIDAGLSSIKFSFQGVDQKGYEEMRQGNNFEILTSIVKKMYNKRGNLEKPFIIVGTSITDESAEDVNKFKNLFEDFSDKIEVGRTTLEYIDLDKLEDEKLRNRIKELKEKQTLKKVRYKHCHQVFDVMTIRWNGDVSACCADADGVMTIGNIKENSIKEIWSCKKLSKYREILAANEYEKLPLCINCYDFMGYVDNKAQEIN